MLKLHLGCGQRYLDGYCNIDLPAEGQTVMNAKADIYADFRNLSYEEGTVDEIRNHHLFEHFTRAESLRILFQWRRWLKPGGLLHIETPDFEVAAARFTEADLKTKFKIARHIFGSQEASWALHEDWWGEEKFRFVLEKAGFRVADISRTPGFTSKRFPDRFAKTLATVAPSQVDVLDNITVQAVKTDKNIDEDSVARDILSFSVLGKETEILDVWMADFKGKK